MFHGLTGKHVNESHNQLVGRPHASDLNLIANRQRPSV